ncbi:MAG: acyltransferase [Lachnospiraceae bacterium]|nr:acyltransferase [Lachnospiraceae bacterium]
MKKNRRFSFDAVRCIAVFCILLCHFNARYSFVYFGNDMKDYMLLSQYPFGLFLGDLGVSLFFIISGASLYYNYYDELNVLQFYKKRALSIYPMFWVAYLTLFIFRAKDMLASETPIGYMLLTVTGMDGYLSGVLPNFYLIGEWFLGAIILLYLIFPFIRYLYRYNKVLTWMIVMILYSVFVFFNLIPWLGKSSIIFIRIPEMLFGMEYADILCRKNGSETKKRLVSPANVRIIISVMILMVSSLAQTDWNNCIRTTLVGCAAFTILMEVSENIFTGDRRSLEKISGICGRIAVYSYAIYLVHHVIIDMVCDRIDMLSLTLVKRIGLFAGLVTVIAICGIILHEITQRATLFFYKKRKNE